MRICLRREAAAQLNFFLVRCPDRLGDEPPPPGSLNGLIYLKAGIKLIVMMNMVMKRNKMNVVMKRKRS